MKRGLLFSYRGLREAARSPWWIFALRFLLGSIFVVAAVAKLSNQADFVAVVTGYGILPASLATLYGSVLPWVELITGSFLILGLFPRLASGISTGLVITFMVANIHAMLGAAKGSECGCFGQALPTGNTSALLLDIAMLSMGLRIFMHKTGSPGIGSWLQGDRTVPNGRKASALATISRCAIVILVALLALSSFPMVAQARTISVDRVASSNNIDAEVNQALESGKPAFLYFYLDRCGFCQKQKPIIDDLEQQYAELIVFIRVNGQDQPQAMKEFGVTSFPAMFLISDKGVDGRYICQEYRGLTGEGTLKDAFDAVVAEVANQGWADVVITADSAGGNGTDNDTPDAFRLVRNGPEVVFYIDGNFSQSFAFDSLNTLTAEGSGDDDTLTVDFSQGTPIPPGGLTYNGRGNGSRGDALELVGGSQSNVRYEYTALSDGTINLDGSVIRYTGLEPILDLVPATTLTVNGTNASNAITYVQGSTANNGLVAVDAFETIEFSNKLSLVINGLFGDDHIILNNPSVPTDLLDIQVFGNQGDDVIDMLNVGSGVLSVILDGGDGDDLFRVKPSTSAAVAVYGGSHLSGDTLVVYAQGAVAVDMGSYIWFPNGEFLNVNYTNVETVTIDGSNAADLSITKTVSPDVVLAGEELFYDIEVYNNGPAMAVNVVVTDTLPLGLIYLADTDNCTINTGTGPGGEDQLSCDLGDILPDSYRSFTIKLRVPSDFVASDPDGTKVITNTASVSSDTEDPITNNDSATISSFVEEQADLKVTMTVEPEGGPEAVAGDLFWITIWVDNLGPSAARNVVIRDTILSGGFPGGINVASCAFSVSQGGGAITQFTCVTGDLVQTQFGTDIGTMATNKLLPLIPGTDPLDPSTMGRLRACFRISAKDALNVTNTARVVADTPDPDMSNNQAEVSIPVTAVADLQAFSVFGAEVQVDGLPGFAVDTNALPVMPDPACCNFGGTTVTAGRRIQWDTSVTNVGPSVAHNVRIEVLLPYGASLIENTLTGNPTPGYAPGRCYTEPAGELRKKVICVYDTLYAQSASPPGPVSAACRFQVLIDPALPSGTQLSFDSMAWSDEFDPNLSNNATSIQFDVNNWADLALQKFAVGTPLAGGTMHYEYQIRNSGPSVAHDVTLRDFLPPEVQFLNAFVDVEGGTGGVPLPCGITIGSNVLFCPLGDIPVTGTVPINVFVNVGIQSNVPDGTVLTNSADVSLSDTPDPRNTNNSASVGVTVLTTADLEIQKTSEPTKVYIGDQVKYTISVHNIGPSDAQNVQVTDILPAGLSYEVDTDNCVEGPPGTLVCSLGTLKAGETRTFDIWALTGPGAPLGGTVTNIAVVAADTVDPNPTNNIATIKNLVIGADLKIEKTSDVDEAHYGDTIKFTVKVTNLGPSDVQNATVTDTLPSGVTYVSNTGNCVKSGGRWTPVSLTCKLGAIPAGGSKSFDIVVKVLIKTGTISNTACVKSELLDPDLTNNQATKSVNIVLAPPRWCPSPWRYR